MSDRRQKRLDLLCRLREMGVEHARADHVAAQAELEERRERAEDTQRRIAALDEWADARLAGEAAVAPEILRQAQLFRGTESQALERERAAADESRERTELARGELAQKFEELSVAERLTARHVQFVAHEQLRHVYVELDEAGARRKNLEAKE